MNLNDIVSVTLTEIGATILNRKESQRSVVIQNYKKHQFNVGDEYRTQLWSLFEDFDGYIRIYHGSPFQDCEISIVANAE